MEPDDKRKEIRVSDIQGVETVHRGIQDLETEAWTDLLDPKHLAFFGGSKDIIVNRKASEVVETLRGDGAILLEKEE